MLYKVALNPSLGPCQDLGGLGGKEDEEALTEQIINPDVEGNEESPEDLRFLLKAPKADGFFAVLERKGDRMVAMVVLST
ncbi:hypothetical protein HAX54_036708 [Datura stramonium]|uniref:Uncharacterized protein n=1 Tax=Datura stramonium TaxID=4076 RepID=A0ABS8VL95_DATST|nr:hypothetical protein [Datura stramonium]